jgi:hypothetical protein
VSILSVPSPPDVLTKPLEVKLESFAMFCVVFTLKAFPLYESPVPAVVVAPPYTSPLASRPSPPDVSDGSLSAELNVDDAVEKIPLLKPMVVLVAL